MGDNRRRISRRILPRSLSGTVLTVLGKKSGGKPCGHVGDQRASKKELTVSDSGRLSIVTPSYVTGDKSIRKEENRERRSAFARRRFYPSGGGGGGGNFLLAVAKDTPVTRIPPRRFSPFSLSSLSFLPGTSFIDRQILFKQRTTDPGANTDPSSDSFSSRLPFSKKKKKK